MLVDDHPLVLESVSKLLEPHFTIVGTVQDSREIISRALELRPDVILLDACMPGLSGFAATTRIKKDSSQSEGYFSDDADGSDFY